MVNYSFKQASIWSIIWRVLLMLLSVELIALLFQAFFSFDYFDFFTLLSSLIEYFLIYKITISQLNKQNLSASAVAGPSGIEKDKLLPIALITLLTTACGILFIYPALRILVSFGSLQDVFLPLLQPGLEPDSTRSNISTFLYLFPVAVIAAPIVEELFFRGFILNKWSEKYGNIKGVIFSSLFFMIIHIGSLLIPQLLLGLACAVIYQKTKKLIYPIIVHALYNFLITLPTLFASSELTQEDLYELAFPSVEYIRELDLYSGAFVIFLIAMLFMLIKYGKNLRQEHTPYISNLPEHIDLSRKINTDNIDDLEI